MDKFSQVFRQDIKNIFSSRLAVLIMVGLILIPATYAWFNIYASWDPYGNTGGLRVAVACEDKGGKLLGSDLNVGDDIMKELKSNKNFDWVFLEGRQEVIDGVTSGEYYAGAVIPENYSANFMSITTNNLENPSIDYYVNEKVNPISPIITSKGMSMLKSVIDSTFVQLSSNAVLTALQHINKSGAEGLLTRASNSAVSDLDLMILSIDSFRNGALSLDSLMKSLSSALPYLQSSLSDLNDGVSGLDSAVGDLSNVNSKILVLVSSIARSLPNDFAQINDTIASAFDLAEHLNKDSLILVNQAKDTVKHVIDKSSSLRETLVILEQQFPTLKPVMDRLIADIDATVQELRVLDGYLDTAIAEINQGSALSQDLKNKINTQVSTVYNGLNHNLNFFSNSVAPDLTDALNSVSSSLSSTSSAINNGIQALPALSASLSYASDSAGYAVDGLNSLQQVLVSLKDRLVSLNSEITALDNSDLYTSLQNLLKNNPETVASFFASPVNINKNSIFPVENFGSSMSPFYTSLAIWVGALFLVAILKTDLSEIKQFKGYSKYNLFFSRLTLFAILSMLQALVVSLGDLFILKVYCAHPVQFVMISLLTGLVFCSIMFCLTDTFGNFGKAIAVLVMVFQVAGSGGTYPIELTQPLFRFLQKFMPFTYSVGAMRETVGGIYMQNYISDILMLLLYMAVAFLIAYFGKPHLDNIKKSLEYKMSRIGIG